MPNQTAAGFKCCMYSKKSSPQTCFGHLQNDTVQVSRIIVVSRSEIHTVAMLGLLMAGSFMNWFESYLGEGTTHRHDTRRRRLG
jgi:hypothetical protein